MDFSLQVVKEALIDNGDERNMISSPLSIAAMLNILAFGSGGTHLQSMLRLLGAETLDDLRSNYSKLAAASSTFSDSCSGEAPVLNFVNGAWMNQDYVIKPAFEHVLKSTFNAQIKSLDFTKKDESVLEINSWVKKVTNGLISDMVDSDSLGSDRMMILANALYFKGMWEEKFKLDKVDRYFYRGNNEKFIVPFMQGKYSYRYKSFETFEVASIPYKSNQVVNWEERMKKKSRQEDARKFTMNIFLPKGKDGLPALVKEFGDNPSLFLSETLSALQWQGFSKFLIPKFKYSYGFDVEKLIIKLGLDMSGLSEMVENSPSFINARMFQKARIIVDEKGTEAVAYTISSPGYSPPAVPPPPPPSFVADHPFMFVIKENNSGVPFFVGVVSNPLLE